MKHVKFVVMVVAFWLVGSFGATAASAIDQSLHETLYGIRVNGELVSHGSILLIDGDDHLYAPTAELSHWRFVQPPTSDVFLYKGVSYVALESYAGLVSKIDSPHQEVDITAPADGFTTTRLQVRGGERAPTTVAQSGSYLNYALHGLVGSAAPSFVDGLFDLGVSERSGGAFRTSVFANDLLHNAQAIRLDTVWEINNPDKHQSIHAGDFITQPGSLGIPIRFGGLSFGTDFSTDPQFITFPTPSISGLAALPSTVDVFVNGFQAGSASLPAGPYDLGAIPAVIGQNQARVIVRDITGSEHVVNLSFYSSQALLKRGLSDYSFQAGAERFDYGVRSWSYGPQFVQGTWRQGLSDELTVEGHGESTGAFNNFGIAFTTLLRDAGTLSAGVQQSSGVAGNGHLAQIGYEYRSPPLNVFAQLQSADRNYWELGYSALVPRQRRLFQTGMSFEFGRGDQLSLTSIDRSAWDGGTQQISLATFTHSIRRGSIIISYAKSASGVTPTVSVALVTSLGPRASAYTSSGVQGGKIFQDAAFQSGLPSSDMGDAFNLREHNGDSHSYFVQATHQTQTGSESLGVVGSGNQASVTGDLTGSLVFLDGRMHFARQIMGSYGLVSVPGYAGVGVMLNNQEIGKTDKNGDFVLTSLDGYNRNLISIDHAHLPISANISTFDATTVPTRHGAVTVRFATSNPGGIRITVVDSNGIPLPPGSFIEDATSVKWPVAEDGEAYLAGVLGGRQTFTALRGKIPCEFTITVPDDTTQLPYLGTFKCRDKPAT